MVSTLSFRKIALGFPHTSEQPHFDKAAFRAGKKIFATLDEVKLQASIKLSIAGQDIFSLIDKEMIYPVPNKWGQQGWTIIDLQKVTKSILTDALQQAYDEVSARKS